MLASPTKKDLTATSLAFSPLFFIVVLISFYSICATIACSALPLSTGTLESLLEQKLTQTKPDIKFLYNEFNFRTLWIRNNAPTALAIKLRQMIKRAETEGLNPADYQLALHAFDRIQQATPEQLIEKDIQFSEGIVTFLDHLRNGRFAPFSLKKAKGTRAIASQISIINIFITLLRYDPEGEMIDDFPLKAPLYLTLKSVLAHYRALLKKHPQMPLVDTRNSLSIGSESSDVVALHKILRIYGDLSDENLSENEMIFTEDTATALKTFQSRHLLKPTGIVNATTRKALNMSLEERMNRVLINMERLRWYPDQLGEKHLSLKIAGYEEEAIEELELQSDQPTEKHILVNIAGYEVMAFEGAQWVFSIPIVAGHPTRQTPLFDARLVSIILNPSWGVPVSIMMRDKVPKIIEDISYLSDKGYTVTDFSGHSVDPDDIDWEHDAQYYRLRQRPGRNNALGDLRFTLEDYHNKGSGANDHGIYMHGTPEMALFKKTHRAFSSGCIRLQEPHKLAEWVLETHTEWSDDHLSSALAKKKTKLIKLDKDIPVYIAYLTAWADQQGIAYFGDDPYNRDADLFKQMKLSNTKPLHKETPPWFIQ